MRGLTTPLSLKNVQSRKQLLWIFVAKRARAADNLNQKLVQAARRPSADPKERQFAQQKKNRTDEASAPHKQNNHARCSAA